MRRNRRPIVVTGVVLAALGLVAGGYWGVSVLADQRLELWTAVFATATEEETAAQTAYDARMRNGVDVTARVGSVVATAEFGADAAPEATALRQSFEALDALDDAPPVEPDGEASVDSAEAGFRPPWELFADADTLSALARDAAGDRDALIAAAQAADDAQDAVDDAEASYFGAVATRGTNDIAANTLATKESQVALTRLIEQATDQSQSPSRDGAFLSSFVAAENALAASQASEAAELADPALAVRREIEDYARSLSSGTTLDFVWAPEVNGKGEGWYSGTAQTWTSDGGWAIITLNYGVEEYWGDDENARALVAHEVGHTQAYRDVCWPLFSGPTFHEDQEMWATAWSISLGFDTAGSGIEAYGRPSDEQIAVAGQCR
ncbi:hypothetical protein N1027_00805 [Herbiconiux sp. CPCC 205763]|uniref:Uncharacterized protein n=1 Tax=Herbiconiux aconitum TaxID=2970913 RepID=A0ABT2GM50_9MICO|nr:hypothetical protein [Herbiconiux aconitum]MCS5716672.1 hypothetical protein [Herbiconiux aconitum]